MTSELGWPVFVSAEAAEKVYDWSEAIAKLQHVYSLPHPASAVPNRTVAAESRAWLRTLPAVPPGCQYFGAKLMGMSTTATKAAPGVEYVIVLFDRETSRIAAFVDGNLVTGYRTAATSAAALDRLAPAGPARLVVLGSGFEASTHVRAFAAVRDLSEVIVCSTTPARREAFARKVTEDLGIPARATGDAEEAVRAGDIVLCAARSKDEKPILFGEWLRAGATVVSIGSTIPEQREIDISVVSASDLIVCDMVHEVMEETGDMLAARAAGIDASGIVFSLNDLLGGLIDAQRDAAGIRMFKSVGGGLQDVVVAELILTKALAAGLATPLPITFETKSA
ncbi:ornithine cyclodeaminase family protein [Novosphingobium sp.]|uniref:ornithine cyclodeaminase family protein n=1 Tax=Novosphingobium sp. TaxID=1874826 RepID=UPI003565CA3B